jgi:hypothetical protein
VIEEPAVEAHCDRSREHAGLGDDQRKIGHLNRISDPFSVLCHFRQYLRKHL